MVFASALGSEPSTIRCEVSYCAGDVVGKALSDAVYLAPLKGGTERAMALFVESFALLQKFGTAIGIASGLAGCAALAQERGHFVRAARLYGAVEAVRASAGVGLAPVAGTECERNIAALRTRLDEATFAIAWSEGRAMTGEAAVAYALEVASLSTFKPESAGSAESLSSRELEILRLIADGLSNQEIARVQIMSVGTIKWYASQIYSKLHVRGRTQAVARARAIGLLL